MVKAGTRVNGMYFDIKVLIDEDLEFPKFSVVVSKKISKKAVVRNRIKRITREAFRNIMKEIPMQNGFYLFLVKNPDLYKMKTQDVEELIKKQI